MTDYFEPPATPFILEDDFIPREPEYGDVEKFDNQRLERDAEIRGDVRKEMVRRGMTHNEVEVFCENRGYPPMPFEAKSTCFVTFNPTSQVVETVAIFNAHLENHTFLYVNRSSYEWDSELDEEDIEVVLCVDGFDEFDTWEIALSDEWLEEDDSYPGAERFGSKAIASIFEATSIAEEILALEGTKLARFQPWPNWFSPRLATN